MSKIKCISNPNNKYKVTVNTEYDVIEETDSRYIIINDNNIQVPYGKKLFEIVNEVLSFEDIINSYNNNRITLDNNSQVTIPNILFSHRESSYSCGVYEIINLNESYTRIYETLETSSPTYARLQDVALYIFKRKLNNKILSLNDAMVVMMSTNTNGPNHDAVDAMLEEFDYEYNVIRGNNSNSGNDISVWSVKRH